MDKLRQTTIDTYNRSATELAEYFRGIGPRTRDIEYAFSIAGDPPQASVLEIGCGDGRDAQEIVNRADWYLGIDISKSLIDIASASVPDGNFIVADAASFEFPPQIDIVFAFASLLHCSSDEVEQIFSKAAASLKPGGVFYVSLKYGEQYAHQVQEDRFGQRQFYYYPPELLVELAGSNYEIVSSEVSKKGSTDWVEMALRRKHD